MGATQAADIEVAKVKEELHRLIDQLPDMAALDTLDHVRWLLSDEEETLTQEEWEEVRAGEAEIARGEYVTLEEIKQRLDS